MFTPLTLDPHPIRVMSWQKIAETFDSIEPLALSGCVILMEDYAVKVFPSTSPTLANELRISHELNSLKNVTRIFSHTYGYILSPDSPPDCGDTQDDTAPAHFVYLFMDVIDFDFDQLPDEPKVNEDFYFEILIGLYHARKRLHFTHWDIHSKQLMFNQLPASEARTSRTYPVADFFVTVKDTHIEPKLIDYGKSAMEPGYTDDRWLEPQFKKMWNKSDIYHLSLIFSHRENLSPKFRAFLDTIVLPSYRSSMYALKLEKDSAANFKNIEDLLRLYFLTTGRSASE